MAKDNHTEAAEPPSLLRVPGCAVIFESDADGMPVERFVALAMEIARQKPTAKIKFFAKVENG